MNIQQRSKSSKNDGVSNKHELLWYIWLEEKLQCCMLPLRSSRGDEFCVNICALWKNYRSTLPQYFNAQRKPQIYRFGIAWLLVKWKPLVKHMFKRSRSVPKFADIHMAMIWRFFEKSARFHLGTLGTGFFCRFGDSSREFVLLLSFFETKQHRITSRRNTRSYG